MESPAKWIGESLQHAPAAEAALADGRAITVRVASGSMRPTVAPCETVRVRPGRAAVGEVALLREEIGGAPRLVLHRVLLRFSIAGRDYVVHRGDARGARAYLCREAQLLGVADLAPRATPPLRVALGLVAITLRRIARLAD